MQVSTNPQERLRILESEYNLTRDRISILNQSVIESHKKLSHEIRLLNQEIHSIKSELSELKLATNHIAQELSQFAKKDQVKVLEKYINLWSPLNFVTQSELQQLIKELEEKHTKNKNQEHSKKRGDYDRRSPKAKAGSKPG